jgi:hypothetical protein
MSLNRPSSHDLGRQLYSFAGRSRVFEKTAAFAVGRRQAVDTNSTLRSPVMKCTTILILLLIVPAALADNQERAEKKALQERASELLKEAKDLEKSGELVEARTRYANSQAFWETKDAAQAIKHIDEEIQKRVKDALKRSHQL